MADRSFVVVVKGTHTHHRMRVHAATADAARLKAQATIKGTVVRIVETFPKAS